MVSMRKKPGAMILGPLPPPYIGPAVATEIIINSKLSETYDVIHFDTGVHKSVHTLGRITVRGIILNVAGYFMFCRSLAMKRPDVVLVPISQTTLGFVKDSVYLFIAGIFGLRTLIQLRGAAFKDWLDGASRLTRGYVRAALGMCRGAIVLGDNLRGLFKPYFSDDRIFVVPNGADYRLPPLLETKKGGCLKILYVGNLQPSKGIVDVVEAVALVKSMREDLKIELEVAGSWRDEETRAECLRIKEREDLPVTFLPPVTGREKMLLYAGADMFVFPPRGHEGHPWVIIEAMASGLPIISTDRGAITESVQDGMNGFIVPSGDPLAIASRIGRLAKDVELRKGMGLASRRLYEENFTEQKMINRLSEVFDTIIKEL